MKHLLALAALVSCLLAPQAKAGEAVDALSGCLTSSTTQADRIALVRWIFSTIATHPDLREFSLIDDAERDRLEAASVAVFERLIIEDCRAQTRTALRQEGTEGFQAAFKTLGEIAMGGVVDNAQVQAGMERLGQRLDTQRIAKALLVP